MSDKTPHRDAQPGKAELLQYQKVLHRFLMRRLKSAEDAADVAQEVYLRMLRVEDVELVRSPQAYLFGIASHVVHQFKLRMKRELVDFDSEAVEQVTENPSEVQPDELAEQVATQQHLEWALGQLPPMQRVVFLLRKGDGLSDEEIAARVNLSAHTVKKYLFQAQARLRTLWRESLDNGGKA